MQLSHSNPLSLYCQKHSAYRQWVRRIEKASLCCIALQSIITLLPESQRLQAVNMKDRTGTTILHDFAYAGKYESMKHILALLPESQRLLAVKTQDQEGKTVLQCAALTCNIETIKLLVALYPESELLQAVSMQDEDGWSVLNGLAHQRQTVLHKRSDHVTVTATVHCKPRMNPRPSDKGQMVPFKSSHLNK